MDIDDNLRILLKKAGFTTYGPHMEEKLEKLCELVVKECIEICEAQRQKILDNPKDPNWTEHLAECQSNIRKRFGVY